LKNSYTHYALNLAKEKVTVTESSCFTLERGSFSTFSFYKGSIHKENLHLGEGSGLATTQTNVDKRGGGLAVSGHSFQCGLWNRGEHLKAIYHHLPVFKIEK